MRTSKLIQYACKFATELSWTPKCGQVTSLWCSGMCIHLWVDVYASDRGVYERTVETVGDVLAGMFDRVESREIDHGATLVETVFEPIPEFLVTVQMKVGLNEEGD